MIYLGVRELVDSIGVLRDKKLTLTELAEKTGIARKTLSYLVNHPNDPISVQHLGTLAEFFFKEQLAAMKVKFKPDSTHSDQEIMQKILTTLFQVYPDASEFQDVVPDAIKESLKPERITAAMMWYLYEQKHHPEYVVNKRKQREELLEKLQDNLKKKEKLNNGNSDDD